nr:glycosyltransferase [Pseudomonas sp.]
IAAAVKAAGLQDHYRLMGFHRNPEDLYACMDGYVMSSREEGLGSSVLDALMRRVPVASTDAGGLKEVLCDGRGLLSPVGDAQALARNMERLISDETASRMQRQDMIDSAHAWVRRECDVDSMGDRYLALFEELLRQRGEA